MSKPLSWKYFTSSLTVSFNILFLISCHLLPDLPDTALRTEILYYSFDHPATCSAHLTSLISLPEHWWAVKISSFLYFLVQYPALSILLGPDSFRNS